MNKTMKKIISLVLVVLMCMTSAPLECFVGLDLGLTASALPSTGGPSQDDDGDLTKSGTLTDRYNYYWYETSKRLYVQGSYTMPDFDPTGENPLEDYKTVAEEIIVCGTSTSVGANWFDGFTKVKSISMNASTESIGSCAFANCTSLTSIELPDSAKTVASDAFKGCKNVNTVSINKNLESADFLGYIGSENLRKVTVDDGNTNLKVVDGVVYNADQTVLYFCTNDYDDENALPATLTKIAYGAFSNITFWTPLFCFGGTYSQWEQVEIADNNDCLKDLLVDASDILKGKVGDNLTLTLDYSTGKLVVSGTGDMENYGFNGPVQNNEKVKSIVVEDGVTSIASYMFSNMSSLESVTIGKDVADMKANVFDGSTAIKTITVSADNKNLVSVDNVVFNKDKTKLIYAASAMPVTSYTIPSTVTEICESAFEQCKSLKKVTIPKSVTKIGSFAFSSSITEIVYLGTESELTNITNKSGSTISSIYSDANKIGDNAYYYYDGSTKTVTIVGTGATKGYTDPDDDSGYGYSPILEHCYNAEKIVVEEGITEIGAYLFGDMDNVTSVTLPSTLTSIGWGAFLDCRALTKIVIPDNVTSIGMEAFYECTALAEVTIGKAVETIGADAFYRAAIKSITIPDSVKTIGMNAFYGCYSLEKIHIGKGVTSSVNSAFGTTSAVKTITVSAENENYCAVDNVLFSKDKTTLYIYPVGSTNKKYSIPDTVTTINSSAFENSKNLTALVIPKSVTSIGLFNFRDSANLKDVYYFGTESDWNAIEISNYNDPLKNATRHYVDGQLGDDVFYTLSSDGVLNVIGTGKMWDCSTTNTGVFGWYQGAAANKHSYNETIKKVVIGEGITSVGGTVFAYCTALEEVTLPNTLTTINGYAFSGCSALKTVNIPENVTGIGSGAFAGCSSLTSIVIPDKVTSIGTWAFSGCSSLSTVSLGKNLSSIGQYAFGNGTSSISSITVHSENKYFVVDDNILFNKAKTKIIRYFSVQDRESYTIPSTVTSMEPYAFACVQSLKTITIPDSITSIPEYAFLECKALETVNLPKTITSIGNLAFQSCESLKTINFPDSLTRIGYQAFYHCKSLETIELPDSLTTLSSIVFGDCTSLKNVKLPKNLKTCAWGTFDGCTSLETIELPESLTNISYAMFRGTKIKSIEIPSNVTIIDTYAFSGCTSLTKVTIPDKVETIGSYAFYNCNSLTGITIPDKVETIGTYAFAYCSKLVSITIPASVTTIGDYAFYSCPKLTKVYYVGTEEQWNNITIGTGNNRITETATINYVGESGSLGNNVYYTLNTNSGKLRIYTQGEGNGVVSVSTSPFEGNSDIHEIVVEDGVKRIGKIGLFRRCYGIASVKFSDTVEYVGAIFYLSDSVYEIHIGAGISSTECIIEMVEGTSVDTLTVSPNSEYYIAMDNVIYSKDMKTLVYYAKNNDRTEYTIPDGVTTIGKYAFQDCEEALTLTIPKSVVTVSNYAFLSATALTKVKYHGCEQMWNEISIGEKSNTALTNATREYVHEKQIGDDVYYDISLDGKTIYISGTGATYNFDFGNEHYVLFNGNTTIKKAVIGEGVTVLGQNLFYGCNGLETVELPNTLTDIESRAFAMTALKSITIPASVKYIAVANSAFYNTTSLAEIIVDEANTVYKSVDGALLSKDGKNFYLYPSAKKVDTYTLPSTVTTLASRAFYLSSIKTLIIPEGVTALPSDAVLGMTSLRELYLPSTLTEIDKKAFNSASGGLSTIYFKGTQSQWSELTANVTSDVLTKAKVYYGLGESVYYSFDSSTGAVEIIGTGATYDYSGSSNPSPFYDSSAVRTVTVGEGVTRIGNCLFNQSNTKTSNLTSITFPSTLKSIGGSAFIYSKLKSVDIPASVTEIGAKAFYNSESLETVTLHEGLETIGNQAFLRTKIKNLHIPSSVTSIYDNSFHTTNDAYETLTVGEGNKNYKAIDNVLFTKDGTKLIIYPNAKTDTAYTIPAGVTTLGEYAFGSQDNLKEITVPSSLKELGKYNLSSCSELTDLYYEGTQSMGDAIGLASKVRSNVTVHYLYDEKNKIGDNVYYRFDEETVVLTIAGTGAMYDYEAHLADKLSPLRNNTDIKSVVIGEGVTTVGKAIFDSCSAIESVTLPSTIEKIGDYAFFEAKLLESIVIPEKVTTIGECAFYDAGLKSLDIPDSVTSIGQNAFCNVTDGKLESIHIGKGLSSIYTYTFLNKGLKTITVDEANENFKAIDNVLFTKDATILVQYPVGRTDTIYIVPNTVSNIAYYAFYGSNLEKVVIQTESGITIAGFAFASNSKLKEIVLPKNITMIDSYVFHESGLTDVYYAGTEKEWEDSLYLVQNSENGNDPLLNATIHYNTSFYQLGDNVYGMLDGTDGSLTITGTGDMYDYIGNDASLGTVTPFSKDALNVTSVTVGEGVTSIGEKLFYYCSELKTVSLPTTLKTIGYGAFIGTGITSINIPAAVTKIGAQAFGECFSLENITVSEGNQNYKAQDGALYAYDMRELMWYSVANSATEFTIPDGVTSIDTYAFYGAKNLEKLYVPASIETVHAGAFYDCYSLSYVYYGSTPEDWDKITIQTTQNDYFINAYREYKYDGKLGDNIFFKINYNSDDGTFSLDITGTGAMYNYKSYYDTNNLDVASPIFQKIYGLGVKFDSVTISEGITNIGDYVFEGVTAECDIVLPSTVTTIGNGAFYAATLNEITISESVTKIGDKAFYYTYIPSVTIPDSVTEIGTDAFKYCLLETLHIGKGIQSAQHFALCFYLETVTVSDESEYLKVGDGVVLTKDGKKLEIYLAGNKKNEYTIPDGVTTIGKYAFGESNFEWLYVSTDLTTVELGAFGNASLRYICYEGTEAQWKEIKVDNDDDGENNAFLNATVYYAHTEHTFGEDGKCTVCGANHKHTGLDSDYVCPICKEKQNFALITSTGATGFDSLNEALAYANDGDTVKLLKDIDHGSVTIDKAITFDLNGHTWENPSSYRIEVKADATITNSGEEGVFEISINIFSPGATIAGGTYWAIWLGETGVENDNLANYLASCAGYYDENGELLDLSTETAYRSVTVKTAHTFGDVTEAKAPTCLATGHDAYKQCTECNKYFAANAEVSATGKNDLTSFTKAQLSHSYTGEIKDNKDGTHSYKCVNGCNIYSKGVLHTWDNGTVTTQPTHLNQGVKTYKCTCGATRTENVDKLKDHTYTSVVTAPTCTEQGYTTHTCECGDTYTDSYVQAKGHSYTGDYKINENTKDGTHSQKCVNGCNGYGNTVAHTWDDGTVTKDATMFEPGVKTFKCVCGASYTEEIEQLPNPYRIGDNVYYKLEGNALTIYGTGATYDYTYNQDSRSPFYDTRVFSSIVVEEGVTYLGDWLIPHVLRIGSVKFPSTLTEIGDRTFFNSKIQTVEIPGNVKKIGDDAFWNADIETLILNEGIETIGTQAFYNNSELKSVHIPASVTSIGTQAFAGGYQTETVTVDANNKNYKTIDNVLFTKDGTTLLYYPHGKADTEYTIPSSVTTIGTYAFENIDKMLILHIPSSITTVEMCGFYEFSELTDVYYDGTEADFEKLEVDPDMFGEDAIMHFVTPHTHDFTGALKDNGDGTHSNKCTGCEAYGNTVAHTWDNGTVTTQPTHLNQGVKTYTCTCGATKTESVEKIKDHNYTSVVTAPTCTEQGYTTHTCECGDTYTDTYVQAKGHSYTGEIKDNKDGTHSYKCVNGCNGYGNTVAHTWDNGTVTTQPTHLNQGVKTYTCTCGATKTESVEKIKDHNYTSVVTAPTCTEQGYTTHTCECGDTYTDTYVDATGHHYENGKCTSCGAEDPNYKEPVDCDCMCHNDSKFVQFFYKIFRWFWKIFKIHKTCDCGIAHY